MESPRPQAPSARSKVVGSAPRVAEPLHERARVGIRFAIIVGVTLAVCGLAGHLIRWPVISSTLGPTAYVFAAHPDSETAHWRNALVGHSVGLAAGLAALAAFGLWTRPGEAAIGFPIWAQVGAASVAIAVTLVALELVRCHHAPAGATSLLVATGLAAPGRPLDGLLVGLALVLVLGPVIGRLLPSAAGSGSD